MKEGVVAFVDILGFSNLVKEASKKSPANLDHLLHVIENLADTNHEGGVKEIEEGVYEISTTTTGFSDSLVISQYLNIDQNVSCNGYGLIMALRNVAYTASCITGFCLSRGLLVRGGISFGTIKHTKNIIFGSPYIEAVEIENNLAAMPRIVINKSLIDEINKKPFSHDFIKRDQDGLFFIDWIQDYLTYLRRINADQGIIPSKGQSNLKNLKPLIKKVEDEMNY